MRYALATIAIAIMAAQTYAADIVLYSTVAPVAEYPATVGQCVPGTSYADFDDGYYGKGGVIPAPRFSVVGEGSLTNQIRDNATGLIWARSITNCIGQGLVSWTAGISAVTNINASGGYGGTNDWRMPNLRELFSVMDYSRVNPSISGWTNGVAPTASQPWNDLVLGQIIFWASTTRRGSTTQAWRIETGEGQPSFTTKATAAGQVWMVRGP